MFAPHNVTCVMLAPSQLKCNKTLYNPFEEDHVGSANFYRDLAVALALCAAAAIASGLTMAYLTLDKMNLEVCFFSFHLSILVCLRVQY